MKLIWSVCSNRGHGRDHNEDQFLAGNMVEEQLSEIEEFCQDGKSRTKEFFAVSDGLGGYAKGEECSLLAMRKCRNNALQWQSGEELDLAYLLTELNRSLADKRITELAKMGATIAVAAISQTEIAIGNVGDTRIYYVSERQPLHQVSMDHNEGAIMKQMGYTEEEIARNPRGRSLTQYLGMAGEEEGVHPYVHSIPLERGWNTCILCTDGLWEVVTTEDMEQVILTSKKKEAAKQLVQQALNGDAHDNITAIVIHIKK